MKKRNLLILILVCVLSLLVLSACNNEKKVNEDPITGIEIISDTGFVEIGNFSFDNFAVLVKYESGRTEEVELTEDMINERDRFKFYTVGDKEITVSAFGFDVDYKFTVKQKQMKDLYLVGFEYNEEEKMYKKEIPYTGIDFNIEVGGEIPSGAIITYPNGESFTKVGIFDFAVYVSCDTYDTYKLVGSLTIERGEYDLSDITFDAAHYAYDGQEKSLSIRGDLPEGVTVSYGIMPVKGTELLPGNSAVDAGSYFVYAKFIGDFTTHVEIPDMLSSLTIDKFEYDITNVVFSDSTFKFDGKPHTLTIEDESTLPRGVYVEYENNTQVNAGEYQAIAHLYCTNSTNYTVAPVITAKLKISKADYDLSGVIFDSQTFIYDGDEHKVELAGQTLPLGVVVTYQNNYQKDAGDYNVIAHFEHQNSNYNTIPEMVAKLRILKAVIDLSRCTLDTSAVIYDGHSHRPVLEGPIPNDVTVRYEYKDSEGEASRCIDSGKYSVAVIFEYDKNNFEPVENMHATLEIIDREITYNMIGFETEKTLIYNGEIQHNEPTMYPDFADITYETVLSDAVNPEPVDSINVGTYRQTVKFSYYNGSNDIVYNYPQSVYLTIDKFQFDSDQFRFNDMRFDYEGRQVQVVPLEWIDTASVFDTIPVTYTFKSEGGSDFTNIVPRSIGYYTCRAVFDTDNALFNNGAELVGYYDVELEIVPAHVTAEDILSCCFDNESNPGTIYEYTGEELEAQSTKPFASEAVGGLYYDKFTANLGISMNFSGFAKIFGTATFNQDIHMITFDYEKFGHLGKVTVRKSFYNGTGANVDTVSFYYYGDEEEPRLTEEVSGQFNNLFFVRDPGEYFYEITLEANDYSGFDEDFVSEPVYIRFDIGKYAYSDDLFKAQTYTYTGEEIPFRFSYLISNQEKLIYAVRYNYTVSDEGYHVPTPDMSYDTPVEVGEYTVAIFILIDKGGNVNVDKDSFDAAVAAGPKPEIGLEKIVKYNDKDGDFIYSFQTKLTII